jgi:3'-phosphoadenosine 5'-phosphosulfate sulfotransferase (PAPS reductase)/FAD synthetase
VIAVSPEIDLRLRNGAVVAYSLSGGKDSSVAAHAVNSYLDWIGHPRSDRVAIHADLGRIEWSESHAICEAIAGRVAAPLKIVRHSKHDMISRWEQRFENGKRRYQNLEIFNLIGPWSSASLRFCTSEMKQQVISPALKKMFPGRPIISVIGVRRDESANRASAPVSKVEGRWTDARTTLLSWNPILNMTEMEVFAYHDQHDLPLHPAYRTWGCSRVSCRFCVLQKQSDQVAASREPGAPPIYRHLVGLEIASTFSFQPSRWLGDVSPHLLTPDLVAGLRRAKQWGAERRALESSMPKGLRYVAGWPLRAPTAEEAEQVVRARDVVLAHHGLDVLYPTPRAVIDRFEALMAKKVAA